MAEVLITLGIIGIVAALTLPSLVSNYKKRQTEVRLKKFYSVMQEAILMSKANQTWDDNTDVLTHRGDNELLKVWFEETLAPYMKIAKKCGTSKNKDCIIIGNNDRNVKVNFVDGIAFSMNNNAIIHIYVDINGTKKPNKMGIDRFVFFLSPTNGNFWASNYSCLNGSDIFARTRAEYITLCGKTTDVTVDSSPCSGLIMLDGWEIKDDYPLKF